MRSRISSAFTLVELLTTIAIVGVLTAIIIPVVGKVRETSRSTGCLSNLRGIHAAAMLWSADNARKLPDARYWAYNEGASNAAHRYQLANYLEIRAPKGVAWGDPPSPMKCESSFALRSSSQEWGRTYAINAHATSTLDGAARDPAYGYPPNQGWVVSPSRLAFFMDGAVSPNHGAYVTNVGATHAATTHSTPMQFPHGGATNVVFLDGRVERISREVMLDRYPAATTFWRQEQL